MRFNSVAVSLLGLAGWVGCSSAGPEPPAVAAPAAAAIIEPAPAVFACPHERGLCFDVQPATAELIIEDDVKGRINELGEGSRYFLALESGIYRVTLRADGFVSWRAEVSVREDAERIEVTLAAAP